MNIFLNFWLLFTLGSLGCCKNHMYSLPSSTVDTDSVCYFTWPLEHHFIVLKVSENKSLLNEHHWNRSVHFGNMSLHSKTGLWLGQYHVIMLLFLAHSRCSVTYLFSDCLLKWKSEVSVGGLGRVFWTVSKVNIPLMGIHNLIERETTVSRKIWHSDECYADS